MIRYYGGMIVAAIVFAYVFLAFLLVAYIFKAGKAGFDQGRRAGLKEAATVAHDAADAALNVAPVGQQLVGYVRAQVAHNIELQLLERVGGGS